MKRTKRDDSALDSLLVEIPDTNFLIKVLEFIRIFKDGYTKKIAEKVGKPSQLSGI